MKEEQAESQNATDNDAAGEVLAEVPVQMDEPQGHRTVTGCSLEHF